MNYRFPVKSDLCTIREENASTLLLAADALEAGRKDQAERYWREYLEVNPNDPDVCYNLGWIIKDTAKDKKQWREAAEWFGRAMNIPGVPMDTLSNCYNELGNLSEMAGRTDKARIGYGMALHVNPDNIAARTNYADSLRSECKFEEADAEYAKVLEKDPSCSDARFSRGMIALLYGHHELGWADYESRWDVYHFSTKPFVSERPLWKGEDLSGKTLLITREQGHGDTFQFIRYAQELKRKWPTCRVWLYCMTMELEVMRGVAGLDRCFDRADVEDFDFHVPIMSLPHRLGTTQETIPANVPYIFNHREWPVYELPNCDKRKVGLVWAGSPRHGKDKYRSIEPEQFQPIIDAHPECQFYSLQVGPRWEEVKRLNGVISLAESLLGWEYTAQAIQQLDLVISVDTAVVHLAGALGKPCLMLTPHSPDFRWGLNSDRTPWYPQHRLFRQSARDDWQPVLNRINKDL